MMFSNQLFSNQPLICLTLSQFQNPLLYSSVPGYRLFAVLYLYIALFK